MRDLTVLLFKWQGWRSDSFRAQNVNAVARMLERYLRIPHKVVCVTDDPKGVECETFPLWDDPLVTKQPTPHANWRRLKVMSGWAAEQWPGWVLVLDVDVLIRRDITSLITWDELRILEGKVSRYRTGIFLHKTGTRRHVWDSFDPDRSPFVIPEHKTHGRPWVGSDQGWISVTCNGERLYTEADGVYAKNIRRGQFVPADARVLLTMGEVKPWHDQAKRLMPSLYREYRQWLD